MTKILPIRGSNTEINNTPIVDGQLLFEINSSNGQNHIYMDNGTVRIPIGLNDWSQIVDKPFSSIGVGLNVINGVLSLSSPLNVSWSDVKEKLFDDIGNGLFVSQGELKANIKDASFGLRAGTASAIFAKYQQIMITDENGYSVEQINGTKYMEYSQTLNTNSNTVYTFTSSDDITLNGAIDVFTSIYGFKPTNIVAANGVCTVTFPPYDTANTSMTCRIYIKDKQYE